MFSTEILRSISAQTINLDRSRQSGLICTSSPPCTETVLAIVEPEPSELESHVVFHLTTEGKEALALPQEGNGQSDITADLPSTVTCEQPDAQGEEDLLFANRQQCQTTQIIVKPTALSFHNQARPDGITNSPLIRWTCYAHNHIAPNSEWKIN